VEPDYLLVSEVCFSRTWTPFPNGGVGGGFPPHNCCQGGPGGGKMTIFVASPLAEDSGTAPPKQNIGKNCLVKYCNFVVNLDRSL
jgi:hypothetical protein